MSDFDLNPSDAPAPEAAAPAYGRWGLPALGLGLACLLTVSLGSKLQSELLADGLRSGTPAAEGALLAAGMMAPAAVALLGLMRWGRLRWPALGLGCWLAWLMEQGGLAEAQTTAMAWAGPLALAVSLTMGAWLASGAMARWAAPRKPMAGPMVWCEWREVWRGLAVVMVYGLGWMLVAALVTTGTRTVPPGWPGTALPQPAAWLWGATWLMLGLSLLVPLGLLWLSPSGPPARRWSVSVLVVLILGLGLLIAHQAAQWEQVRTLARFHHRALEVQRWLTQADPGTDSTNLARHALQAAESSDLWVQAQRAAPLQGLVLSLQLPVHAPRATGTGAAGASPWALPSVRFELAGRAGPITGHLSVVEDFWGLNAPTWPAGVLAGSLLLASLCQVGLAWASGRRLAMQAELEHSALEVHQCLLLLEDTVLGYRQQSEQLQLVLRSTPAGFVAFGSEGQTVFVNPALASMLDCPASDLLGLDRNGFADRLSAMARGDAGALTHLLLDDRPRPEQLPLRIGLVLGAESERVLEFACSRVEGELVQLVCSVVDVTESVRLEHSKSQFLANAAHEIRTPLTSILGYAQLLASRPSLAVEVRGKMQQEVVNKAQELSALLGNMLDLAELESDATLSSRIQRLELNEALGQALATINPPEGASPVQWQPCDLPLGLQANPSRLLLLLRHLVSNAWSFSAPGTPVRVQLSVQADDAVHPVALLEVEDQGRGMNPEELSRVFERFWRADESGARPGFGLGLCIVREIVRQLHGHIELHSQPGQGTRVRVTLPLLSVGALADAA